VIRPRVGNLHWSVFSHAGNLIAEGEKATEEKMHDIKKVIPFFTRFSARRSKTHSAAV
jgi:hypothetical protein